MRTTFDTSLGICGIGWDEQGLTRFELPPAAARSDDTAPPGWVHSIIERVRRHLRGEPQDFSDLTYDFSRVGEFCAQVLRATLAVPSGQTRSYGEIAAAIGQPAGASRSVGAALGSNPWPLLIPCHRIIASDGKMTGFSGPGGIETKLRLLALEGAQMFPF